MTTLNPVPEEPTIYSVSLISKALRDVVEGQFSGIRVKGEVTGLKRHTSGHIYFALKDTEAVMDAVSWRGTKQVDLLREGLEIIAYGKITTYPGRSKYQMIVTHFEPSGEGALLQLLLQLKEKLRQEGLFEERYKKKLPAFPKRIGLITSPTGAVLRDIMHRLRERYPCSVLIKPVLVQGDGAALQVTEAIRLMNALEDHLRPDVLIIARGGGSLEDLFAFNDENLVRAAFESRIPLISAIGHETDFTLLDFVADVRAPTPTAAAELATPVLTDIRFKVLDAYTRLNQAVQNILKHQTLKLERFEQILKDPLRYLFDKQQKLDDWGERLQFGIQHTFVQKRLQLGQVDVKPPRAMMDLATIKLTHSSAQLRQNFDNKISGLLEKVHYVGRSLENMSYKKTLSRGFCLAHTVKGDIIASLADVRYSTPFVLELVDGTVDVKAIPSLNQQKKLF